ncbi:MAG: hypothetical protein ACI9O4_001355 [Chitinophagales bacterium]|jgi:hypothetical protein
MNKLILVLGVGALMSFMLNSCSKCATCSDSKGFHSADYAKEPLSKTLFMKQLKSIVKL